MVQTKCECVGIDTQNGNVKCMKLTCSEKKTLVKNIFKENATTRKDDVLFPHVLKRQMTFIDEENVKKQKPNVLGNVLNCVQNKDKLPEKQVVLHVPYVSEFQFPQSPFPKFQLPDQHNLSIAHHVPFSKKTDSLQVLSAKHFIDPYPHVVFEIDFFDGKAPKFIKMKMVCNYSYYNKNNITLFLEDRF